MRGSILAAALIGLVPALSGCETPGDRVETIDAPRQCFFPRDARSFRAPDADTLYVGVRRDEVFELDATGFCQDIDFANQIAIVSRNGVSRLCTGDFADLVVPSLAEGSARCNVRVVRRLTPEEEAALPSRDRP